MTGPTPNDMPQPGLNQPPPRAQAIDGDAVIAGLKSTVGEFAGANAMLLAQIKPLQDRIAMLEAEIATLTGKPAEAPTPLTPPVAPPTPLTPPPAPPKPPSRAERRRTKKGN